MVLQIVDDLAVAQRRLEQRDLVAIGAADKIRWRRLTIDQYYRGRLVGKQPFHRIVSISGIAAGMDDEQVAEAKKAMEELDKQLASMPESQREMMKSMMGPQMEQMRNLAESGSFKSEVVIEAITPNPEAFGERIVACK